MNESDDLIGKADALLGRYRKFTPPSGLAAAGNREVEFPVLTEVVESPLFSGEQPAEEALKSSGATTAAGPLETKSPSRFADLLIDRILSELEPQLLFILEPVLRNHFQRAMDSLVMEMHAEVGEVLRAAVNEAVQDVMGKSASTFPRQL